MLHLMPATLLLSATLLAAPPAPDSNAGAPQLPSAPASDATAATATPTAVKRVLAARPFVLAEGFESDWRAERPLVRSGWLMVVEADVETARPRQTAAPVLYVGDQVAERLNTGGPAAADAAPGVVRLVILVPAATGEGGTVTQPLLDSPAFFGTAMLPEQVDAARAQSELAAAKAAGVAPPRKSELDEAVARGGAKLDALDRAALLKAAAVLVRSWSPTEQDQADLLEGKPVTTSSTPTE